MARILVAAAAFASMAATSHAAPLSATKAAAAVAVAPAQPLNANVFDVINSHPNLTSFANSMRSTNLTSFLSEPLPLGVFAYTVLAYSDAAFSALPKAMKGMFDVASLRDEFLAHHINLRASGTPNSVCAAAGAPLPGYNVTTSASQNLAILCFTCDAIPGRGDGCPTVSAEHTLGNATFQITATPIVASNGNVIVIDGILLPPWLPPANAPIRPAPASNEPFVFRAINHARHDCGQVDAASSVPPAIYKDEASLKRYIELTITHFSMPDGVKLELGTCAEAGYTKVDPRRPPETIDWTGGRFTGGTDFTYYCASDLVKEQVGMGCGCVIGHCPEMPPPDKPICAICNAATNRDRVVEFFVPGGHSPPAPPPDIFRFILDALANTPELSIMNRIVQGNQTKDDGNCGGPCLRECPRGHASPDCSYPQEEPDGRQSVTGTIESEGPWTFFAPDNAAFAKAPAVKAALLAGFQGGKNPGYLDNAFDTLYYHLLAGNYSVGQLPSGEINTLEGVDITTSHLGKHFTFVTGGLTSNVARVKKSIKVTNGVVHIISAVLVRNALPSVSCSRTTLSRTMHILASCSFLPPVSHVAGFDDLQTPPADTRPSKQQGYNTCCAAGVAQSCCDACCKGGNIQCC